VAAHQHGIACTAEIIQQGGAGRIALAQHRKRVARCLQQLLEPRCGGLHGAQAGAQHKGPPPVGPNQGQRRIHHGGRVPGVRGQGQARRHVEHGLLGVVVGAGPGLALRVFQAQGIGEVAEVVLHRQGGRGEDPGLVPSLGGLWTCCVVASARAPGLVGGRIGKQGLQISQVLGRFVIDQAIGCAVQRVV